MAISQPVKSPGVLKAWLIRSHYPNPAGSENGQVLITVGPPSLWDEAGTLRKRGWVGFSERQVGGLAVFVLATVWGGGPLGSDPVSRQEVVSWDALMGRTATSTSLEHSTVQNRLGLATVELVGSRQKPK